MLAGAEEGKWWKGAVIEPTASCSIHTTRFIGHIVSLYTSNLSVEHDTAIPAHDTAGRESCAERWIQYGKIIINGRSRSLKNSSAV